MSHHRQSTWCCEESETPRVRTIFPSASEPAAAVPIADLASAATTAAPQDWPGLLAAILRAIVPFTGALEAARQVIRDARASLPTPVAPVPG